MQRPDQDAIDFETPPKYVPKLAVLAAQLYAEGGRELRPEALARLQQEIDELRADPNAQFWALMSLEGLSQVYARNGEQRGADQLSALIRGQRDRHQALARRIVERWRGGSATTAAATVKALGQRVEKPRAPMYGAAAPAGTTRLAELAPRLPGRRRP